MKRIDILDKLGAQPATTRQSAAFLDLFMNSKVNWFLDFTGVESLTPVFMEEFFGKLADQFGPEVFKNRLTWRNLEAKSQRTLHALLQERFQRSQNL